LGARGSGTLSGVTTHREASAPLPDADEAPDAEDLVPEAPPAEAPMVGDPDKKPAVAAPVPAHGEMASAEQLAEGEKAVEASEDRAP
jgi:hypothetical protein